MTTEVKSKIWELKYYDSDDLDLILDYYSDSSIDFYPAARAIEQIVGVEWVEVYPGEHKMRVILHASKTTYNKLAPIFEKLYGILPDNSWGNNDTRL